MTTDAPAVGLASLPPFIAQSIVQSAVPGYEQNKLTVSNVHKSEPFRDLACVCKHWRTLAFDAASNVALCSLVVCVENATRGDLVELRRQLTLQRAFLVALDIHKIPRAGLIRADQWAAALSCAPHLQEVKLDSLHSEEHGRLGAIVRAAGQQCRSLQSLVVAAAHKDNSEGRVPVDFQRRELTDPIYDTIQRVYENTNRVGLRRLCVSMRHDVDGLEATRAYFNKVLQFCPNLERFDGYRAAVYALDTRVNYERWVMDVELWTRFCSTLHQLSEFDWITVPFGTQFFEIFGQHPKPKLKSLTFTTPVNWNWDRLVRDVGAQGREQLVETGYAGTAKHAHAALTACPNLKELLVAWHREVLISFSEPPLPQTSLMDPEIFGDDFWEAAVRLCPLLTRVSMVHVQERAVTPTVRSFTDRSLRSLARLPSLNYFEAANVNVTGDGIFELAVHHAPSLENDRRFHFVLGEAADDSTDMRFYDVITMFLEKLLAGDAPLPCTVQKVSATIENLRTNPVDVDWSKTYLTNLKALMAQVKAKHVGVQLDVFAHDCDGTEFSQIREFVFGTREDLLVLWMEEEDTNVGDGIWNRLSDSDYGDADDDDWDDDDWNDDEYFSDEMDGDGDYDDYDYDTYYDRAMEELWEDQQAQHDHY